MYENVSQFVAGLVSSVNGSIEKHGHIVGHMCVTCVRVSENMHAHSRTQVQQHQQHVDRVQTKVYSQRVHTRKAGYFRAREAENVNTALRKRLPADAVYKSATMQFNTS